MSSCEKCWGDAYRMSFGTSEDQVEVYQRLIRERDCSPEEQAGTDAEVCPLCGRRTLHQVTGECMNNCNDD